MKSPRACRNLEQIRAAVNAIDKEFVKLVEKIYRAIIAEFMRLHMAEHRLRRR